MRCLSRAMRMNILNSLYLSSFLYSVLCEEDDTVGGPNLGAGEEYLEMTETKWDGKTPWFTGSSMCLALNL